MDYPDFFVYRNGIYRQSELSFMLGKHHSMCVAQVAAASFDKKSGSKVHNYYANMTYGKLIGNVDIKDTGQRVAAIDLDKEIPTEGYEDWQIKAMERVKSYFSNK